MEEGTPPAENLPGSEANEEDLFLFVGAATEVPENRWPPLTENDKKEGGENK